MLRILISLAVFLIGWIITPNGVTCADSERDLIRDLMRDYDTDARPVDDPTAPVTVKMGLALNQLIDLDERNQMMIINVWLRFRWQDDHLKWDPAKYGGITTVRIMATRLWTPDITLYNDVRDTYRNIQGYFPAVISSDGAVMWNAPDIIKATCLLDVTYFPWDEQHCHLKYGSWTYDGTKVDITNLSIAGDETYFIPNGEWNLVGIPLRRQEIVYGCCPEPYPDVTFWIVIRRKALYYMFNLILPCVFITATTILVFYLPPDSGEKVSLGVTVLLALTVFLLLVAETMPPQSEVIPLIGQYFGATIMMLSMSTALTVVVLNVHHRGAFGNEVPYFVRLVILNWLATVMCLKKRVDENITGPSRKNKVSANNNQHENLIISSSVSINDLAGKPSHQIEADNDEPVRRILHVLEGFQAHIESKQRDDGCREDWMLVAMVLDRFLLIIFTFLTVVTSLALLLNHPEYDDNESLKPRDNV